MKLEEIKSAFEEIFDRELSKQVIAELSECYGVEFFGHNKAPFIVGVFISAREIKHYDHPEVSFALIYSVNKLCEELAKDLIFDYPKLNEFGGLEIKNALIAVALAE